MRTVCVFVSLADIGRETNQRKVTKLLLLPSRLLLRLAIVSQLPWLGRRDVQHCLLCCSWFGTSQHLQAADRVLALRLLGPRLLFWLVPRTARLWFNQSHLIGILYQRLADQLVVTPGKSEQPPDSRL